MTGFVISAMRPRVPDIPQKGVASLSHILAMTDVCTAARLPLVQQAFRLEWLTIGFAAAVSIAAGIMANSLVLLAFGLDEFA
jgi:hypothetical protein